MSEGNETEATKRRTTINDQPLTWYPGEFQRLLKLAEPPLDERTLRRWIQVGRDSTPPELPPLDEPYRLAQWYARRMKQRVPDWIKAIERQHFGGSPNVQVAAVRDATQSAATTSLGILGVLDRCRAVEAAAGDRYAMLLRMASQAKDFDEGQRYSSEADQARRAWDDSVERLRTMELAAPKILAAYGKTWPSDEVIASLETIHVSLKTSVENLLKRVRPKLQGKAPAEQDAIYAAEVETMFASLRSNKFMEAAA